MSDGRVAVRDGADPGLSPEELAARFVAEGAQELHLVDLDAARTGQARNTGLLARIARAHAIPARLAGGISDLRTARAALAEGFAGVLFSSAVFADDALLRDIAALGERAIVEIEAVEGWLAPRGGDPALVADASGRGALSSARAAVDAGIRAIYVVDVASDGRLTGPALALIQSIRSALGSAALAVAFHTGGGIRDLDDIRRLAGAGIASAVVGRALLEGRFSIADARRVAQGHAH
ncbi:MAG: HisA/HisF-related TIM barrel protein [Chloroflexota bacterium]|nr:HisA/HisF-related TIM barrel protein [Chloroflexota bacterium]